jgi:hypothetical protein
MFVLTNEMLKFYDRSFILLAFYLKHISFDNLSKLHVAIFAGKYWFYSIKFIFNNDELYKIVDGIISSSIIILY